MSEPIRVGVVVVSWENSDLTIACLSSLLALKTRAAWGEFSIQIVISDNQSSSEVVAALREWVAEQGDGRVEFLEGPGNGGYAAGANRGIQYLQAKHSPEWIWILNNDVEVQSDALLTLIKDAERRPEILMWGSTILEADHENRLQCAGGYNYSPLTTRNRACHAGEKLEDVASLPAPDMDYVCGAAMLCKAELFKTTGLFCEDYFLYFEELDMTLRLARPAPIAWSRGSVVTHFGAAGTATVRAHRSVTQQYYENLSTLRFTAKFFPVYLPIVFMARLFLKPLLFLFRSEWHLYRPFYAAYYAFLFGPDSACSASNS